MQSVAKAHITAAVSSKYLKKYTKTHCELVKHIFQYLQKNNYELYYPSGGDVKLEGFVDSSYANDLNYQSRGEYCFKSETTSYHGTQTAQEVPHRRSPPLKPNTRQSYQLEMNVSG